jgi:hypothetical protein
MSDMASVSIGAPSEPAAAHEATDDAPIPPAGEIEHHSEHNASFLEMVSLWLFIGRRHLLT